MNDPVKMSVRGVYANTSSIKDFPNMHDYFWYSGPGFHSYQHKSILSFYDS